MAGGRRAPRARVRGRAARGAVGGGGAGRGSAVGDDKGGQLGRKQVVDGVLQGGFGQAAQIVHFGRPQHLHLVGVDEIQVADEGQSRFLGGFGRQAAQVAVVSGQPLAGELGGQAA